MAMIQRFWRDQNGATAIEYAVIGALLSIVIVVSATSIGTKLNARFVKVSTGLS